MEIIAGDVDARGMQDIVGRGKDISLKLNVIDGQLRQLAESDDGAKEHQKKNGPQDQAEIPSPPPSAAKL